MTPHTTVPLIWEHGGRTFRAVENVLPELADWPAHDPGCCQTACPAVVNGRDPAGCVLRLTGTCAGCRCRGHGQAEGFIDNATGVWYVAKSWSQRGYMMNREQREAIEAGLTK